MTTAEPELLPRNAWGGKVDPVKIAEKIVSKLGVTTAIASAALEETSKIRGKCRIYHEGYAVELLEKVQKVSPDSSEVHQLIGEGYEDDFQVRKALALGGGELEKAREILDAAAAAATK